MITEFFSSENYTEKELQKLASHINSRNDYEFSHAQKKIIATIEKDHPGYMAFSDLDLILTAENLETASKDKKNALVYNLDEIYCSDNGYYIYCLVSDIYGDKEEYVFGTEKQDEVSCYTLHHNPIVLPKHSKTLLLNEIKKNNFKGLIQHSYKPWSYLFKKQLINDNLTLIETGNSEEYEGLVDVTSENSVFIDIPKEILHPLKGDSHAEKDLQDIKQTAKKYAKEHKLKNFVLFSASEVLQKYSKTSSDAFVAFALEYQAFNVSAKGIPEDEIVSSGFHVVGVNKKAQLEADRAAKGFDKTLYRKYLNNTLDPEGINERDIIEATQMLYDELNVYQDNKLKENNSLVDQNKENTKETKYSLSKEDIASIKQNIKELKLPTEEDIIRMQTNIVTRRETF